MVKKFGMSLFGQLVADAIGTRVLPDNRVVDWYAGGAIPEQSGFTLVGDADSGNVTRRKLGFGEGCADHLAGALPDLQPIVLYPATLGKDLLVFALIIGDHRALLVKKHKTGAGCAGINGTNVSGHRVGPVWSIGRLVVRSFSHRVKR